MAGGAGIRRALPRAGWIAPLCLCGFATLCSAGLFAQERTVAITVDDLPYAAGGVVSIDAARPANRKLIAALRAGRVPVTGFAIQKRVEELGAIGAEIVALWTRAGFDLGNHSYSHPDFDDLSIDQIEEEIVRGEGGRKVEFFRFPFNHTGDTKAKHDAIADFLARRGYRVAVCTIDTSDYIFNQAYVRMLAKHDASNARRLRREYLSYSDSEIDYYAALNKRVFGYEPPQVMLLHDNRLNADAIEEVLKLFEWKRYRFVSLTAAQYDAAYRTPDTYITKFGPMWGYRWAQERQVKVDGRLEPEPAKWIAEYGRL